MSTGYDINYSDERFSQVAADKNVALSDLEQTYAGMINSADSYYNSQIEASKQWAEKQSALQQEQTDFAIEQIEQQKEQSRKDYIKEQSGAYTDWQKQSNKYGIKAEQQASAGLSGTGYSESSQVSMYNTYQNRVATAREAVNQAILHYNNAITEARLQNNAALAEIELKALQDQLELALEGFQYKNQLILDKANRKTEIENTYYNRYLDVLNQINQENSLAEEIRQYNASLAEDQRQFDLSLAEDQRQFDASLAEEIRQYNSDNEIYTAVDEEGGDPKPKDDELVDWDSVTAMGLGPLTIGELVNLEAVGLVKAKYTNGKLSFKKTPSSTVGTSEFDPIHYI